MSEIYSCKRNSYSKQIQLKSSTFGSRLILGRYYRDLRFVIVIGHLRLTRYISFLKLAATVPFLAIVSPWTSVREITIVISPVYIRKFLRFYQKVLPLDPSTLRTQSHIWIISLVSLIMNDYIFYFIKQTHRRIFFYLMKFIFLML